MSTDTWHNLKLSEEQEMIRETAHKLADDVLAPQAEVVDGEARFPQDAVDQMAELGFLGLPLAEASGGAGLGWLTFSVALEDLAAACGSTAISLAAHASAAAWIEACGSGEQRQSTLPELASGAKLGALVADGSIIATASGAGLALSGSQALVVNGGSAAVFVVVARLDGRRVPILVPRETPGLGIEATARGLGWRGAGCARIRLDGVVVPATSQLQGGGGTRAAATWRLGVAAVAVGLARSALERARTHAKERIAFGKTLAQQQAVALKLAEMELRTEAARHLVWHAARCLDTGAEDVEREALLAKVQASECATFCGDEAIQIHGGYGYVSEYHVERIYRDAKTCEVAAGTNEACRLLLSTRVLA